MCFEAPRPLAGARALIAPGVQGEAGFDALRELVFIELILGQSEQFGRTHFGHGFADLEIEAVEGGTLAPRRV